MRIDNEPKLNFEDVLLQPKRSTLSSRKDVEMTRKFSFRNSPKVMDFLPIFASNMDGVGTFSMAKAMQEHKMMTVITKSTTPDEWKAAASTGLRMQSVSVCTGTNVMFDPDAPDWNTMQTVLEMFPDIKMITVDVANAYHQNMVDFIKKVRDQYPDKVIVAGNVVTPEMTEELIINGADVVKVGIGPGCFVPGTIVTTDDGPKLIEDVQIGDIVKTHTGHKKKVIDTLAYDNNRPIISINGIESTDNHKYYVIHKKHREYLTDENIHEYAEWVEAKNLTKDYLLLKHK